MEKKVYLYGFDTLHKVLKWQFLKEPYISVANICQTADWIMSQNPDVVAVYAVDDRPGLYWDFRDACKHDFAEEFAFEDMIAREGLPILVR